MLQRYRGAHDRRCLSLDKPQRLFDTSEGFCLAAESTIDNLLQDPESGTRRIYFRHVRSSWEQNYAYSCSDERIGNFCFVSHEPFQQETESFYIDIQ